MGVPGSEGGDDFLDDGNDGGDDFIDTQGEEVPRPQQPSPASSSTSSASSAAPAPAAPRRRVRVKPMPASLIAKWPKVATMLITMNDGTQLLLVK